MRNLLVLVVLLAVAAHATHQPRCGDHLTQDYYDQDTKKWVFETCDDGNLRDNDGCSHTCQREVCGDGIVQYNGYNLFEECDSVPMCDPVSCVWQYCGDGTTQADLGEQCDDGNQVDMDGCSSQCKDEYCGDGVVQYNVARDLLEQCDDANDKDGDGCSSDCVIEYCGDGIVQPELGEVCDLGVYNTEITLYPMPYAWCSPSCKCIGVQDMYGSYEYATKENTCLGALDYSIDVSELEHGMFCSLPKDVGVLGRGSPVLEHVAFDASTAGPASPFYGGWDIDLSGAFNVDTEAEYGVFYKFTTPADSGIVHITTFLDQNHDPAKPYFIEVYEEPCAQPTDYIVSHGNGAYWGGARTGYADVFFWAKPNTEYYFFAGVRLNYYGSTTYGSTYFTNGFDFAVQVVAAPYTEIVIGDVNNVQLSHQAPYYVTEEYRLLMPGQWFKFVVPDFDQFSVGTQLCIVLDTDVAENNYNYVQIYSGGSSVNINSGEYPTTTQKGYYYTAQFTATVGSEWWVLAQCDNYELASCGFSFVVYPSNTPPGYGCSKGK